MCNLGVRSIGSGFWDVIYYVRPPNGSPVRRSVLKTDKGSIDILDSF